MRNDVTLYFTLFYKLFRPAIALQWNDTTVGQIMNYGETESHVHCCLFVI